MGSNLYSWLWHAAVPPWGDESEGDRGMDGCWLQRSECDEEEALRTSEERPESVGTNWKVEEEDGVKSRIKIWPQIPRWKGNREIGGQAEVALSHSSQLLLFFRRVLPKRFDVWEILQDSVFCDNRRVKISCGGNDYLVVKFGDFL